MLGGGRASEVPDDANQLKELLLSSYSTIDRLKNEKSELQSSKQRLENDRSELQASKQKLESERTELQATKHRLEKEIELREEQMRLLVHKLFGRSSEKYSADDHLQSRLFDEAELNGERMPIQPQQSVQVETHTRRKARRRPLPKDLPREVVVLDIPEEQKRCGCGEQRQCIGSQKSERLVVIPMRVFVRRYERLKYGCKHCEGSCDEQNQAIQIADVAPQIIPKGIASAELLAFVVISKFCDALPFYRLAKIFARHGIDINRSTMCGWALEVARKCEPIVEQLLKQIRAGPLVQMDETPVQVLNEAGRSNTGKSYMWVMRGGDPEKPVLVYRYHPSRGKEIPKLYLSGYQGELQTDGYDGYTEIGNSDGIVHVGSWAHARRKFHDAQKAGKKAGAAEEAIAKINNLYRIERRLRGDLDKGVLSRQRFVEVRKKQVIPLTDSLHEWLQEKSRQVLGSSKLGEAVNYTLGQWKKLLRYVDRWYLTPDTNMVENAIRPFCVGRRNWLFAASPRGAYAGATLYTLIETAKAGGLDPYRYLFYIFSKIPMAETEDDYSKLTPRYMNEEEFKVVTAGV